MGLQARQETRICTVVTLRDPVLGPLDLITTRLEYYSARQRMAEAHALRELHAQASAHAAEPPKPSDDRWPFQNRVHTANAILCGDFNVEASQPEYDAVTQAFAHGRLWHSWRVLNGDAPHAPTFRLYERTYGPEPLACDFVFVSDGLKDKVRSLHIDSVTQASDHQPVALELG